MAIDNSVQGEAATEQQVGYQGVGTTEGIGSPISNEAYNVITALQAKLEGLEAYRKYSRDQGAEIWQKMAQTELQGVEVLVAELERLVQEGKFRLQEPGVGNTMPQSTH